MKKFIFLFTATIIIPLLASSQSWITKGSVWHYDYWNIGELGFYKLNYNRDTIIEGHNCQIISDTVYKFYGFPNNTVVFINKSRTNNNYTYNREDSVFFYNDSTFWLLYDFSANIGDSWQISNDTTWGCQPTTLLVTDTGHIILNNKNLRWIYVKSNVGGKYYMTGKVIENIGFIQSDTYSLNTTLFPREVLCDSNIIAEFDVLNFKCYSDSNGIVYNPSGEDCEYYLIHSSINNSEPLDITINIFPNPAENSATFSFSSPISELCDLHIYSSTGKQILENKIQKGATTINIDLQDFSSGIYYYKVVDGFKVIGNGKFLKIE